MYLMTVRCFKIRDNVDKILNLENLKDILMQKNLVRWKTLYLLKIFQKHYLALTAIV